MSSRGAAVIACLAAVVATPCFAQAKGPVAGSFGFDWLRPAAARCEEMSEPLLKRFKQCEYRSDGAFGLSDPLFACRVSERSEYLVFRTRSICANNLETMKANAP